MLAGTLIALALLQDSQSWTSRSGPSGDFRQSSDAPLTRSFGDDGPKILWRRPLGDGYSGLLYEDGTLFAQFRELGDGVINALDAATGETLWDFGYPVTCYEDMALEYGKGPNATPLLADGRLFAVSIDGKVYGLDAESGEFLWELDLHERYGRQKRREEYGFSISPVAVDDTILIFVGGDVHGVVALDPEDGSQVWGSPPSRVSYAQPTLVDVGGEEQLVFFSPTAVIGMNPRNGDFLWQHPVECFTENNLTPALPLDGRNLWVSSQLDGGTRVITIPESGSDAAPEVLWESRALTQAHWDSFRVGDFVYGSLGGNSSSVLAGVNWRTGEVAWKERGFHLAKGVFVDDVLYFLDEDGQLAIARFSPEGVEILDSSELLARVSWTPPILVDGVLYVRDREQVVAVDLSASAYEE